jgi:hypothetical protein
MNMRKIYSLLFVFILLTALQAFSQVWTVPEENRTVVSPFKFVPDSVKKGEAIYMKNCQSCHGLPGKDNWARITPPPGDPAAAKFQQQTDGDMFYKITTGKIPMPEFRIILSENERWNVIAYTRSFNPSYVQPEPAMRPGFTGKIIQLTLNYNKELSKAVVVANEVNKEKVQTPVKGVEILLFAKRFFGNMQIGDPKITNDKGEATFDFPADLPSDLKGGIDLMAMVNDKSGAMSPTVAAVRLDIGKPNNNPSLLDTRAMWSTRDKAPIWLIITFTLAVVVVWSFIFYILYNVMQIRKIS